MRRYLVVANRTLAGEHLRDLVRDCVGREPCHFDVLVPASPAPDHWASTEEEDHAQARDRLDATLEAFRSLGASAEGQVTGPQPIPAVLDALREQPYDEVVLSTLPPGVSRWLRLDLPSRLGRVCPVPVTHVVAEPVHA